MAIIIRTSTKGCPFIKLGQERVWVREALEVLPVKDNSLFTPFVGVRLEPVYCKGKQNGTRLIPQEGSKTAVVTDFPGKGGKVDFNVYKGEENVLHKLEYTINVKGVNKHFLMISYINSIEIEVTKTGEYATKPRVVVLN